MKLRYLAILVVLTAAYLAFELSFNARLLDVVGSAASVDDVHRIEIFGRLLSGAAVALFVLQAMLARRSRAEGRRPGWGLIAIACTLTIAVVYSSLNLLVETIVDSKPAEFRRLSANVVVAQQALVRGQAEIAGLDHDPGLFARPEGRAFVATFPLLLSSAPVLEARLGEIKIELLKRRIDAALGGPAEVHELYKKAMTQTREHWSAYSRWRSVDVVQETDKLHAQHWGKFLEDIGKRGWTPSTVPPVNRNAVIKQVRRKVSVPRDWSLDDELGFRRAIEQAVRKRVNSLGDGSVSVDGKRVPPGLSWDRFVSHAAVQGRLARELGLPAGTRVASDYSSAAAFSSGVYAPLLDQMAREELARIDSPASDFAPDGRLAAFGDDAARAVLVPPLALFFSLTGAITHLVKLFCLLILAAAAGAGRAVRPAFVVATAAGLVLALFGSLALMSNDVTRSSVYVFLEQAARDSAAEQGSGAAVSASAQIRVLRAVAVGQSFAYPLNEWIRTHVLFDFGYGIETD